MKSIVINPRDQKEFATAFTWLTAFGKERNLLTLEDDDTISFVFLMKEKNVTELQDKNTISRPSR